MKWGIKSLAKELHRPINEVRNTLKNIGYQDDEGNLTGDSTSHSGWRVPTFDEDTKTRLNVMLNPQWYDWYCDGCGCRLNDQPGFKTILGVWKCAECGYINNVTSDNLRDPDE